ncbi:MAG: urease subunit alpha, partial [Chloroflexi bacterium]|nr:urease subunit alpha [Chloroflexota bacterium]
ELEDTIAAIAGRTVHAYHVEGSGGGHVPDLLGLAREANVICSSTTPTVPWGVNAVAEALPMTILNHGLSWNVPGDLALTLDRVHPKTMAAEGPLHELGAIQIVNSDSQGMGRIMETLRRTMQLAHVMKAWRASEAGAGHPGLPDDSAGSDSRDTNARDDNARDDNARDDNARALRYLAKVTIEPAIVHGVSAEVGSLEPGRMADLVLWRPAYFGVKPELVLKGGTAAWAPLGEGNATVEGAEPTRYAPHWGGSGNAGAAVSLTFVSGSVDRARLARGLGTRRRLVPVRACRNLTRSNLRWNRATAPIEISPVDGTVSLAARPLEVEPATELPMSRRYFLR